MSEAQKLLAEAYKLHVVDEKHKEAIQLCRQALEIEPGDYRVRVFLGILLGDHGDEHEIIEARRHFIDAIRSAEKPSVFCTDWPEEAAIHHLGIWELARHHQQAASLFFLIDYLACGNESSHRHLLKIVSDIDAELSHDVEMILKRLKLRVSSCDAEIQS